MIEAHDLTKRYGDKLAVDHLSFKVEPGRVTGFLGPNGAGKSTTMRLILGLDRPDRERRRSTAGGTPSLPSRCATVGALLEAKAMQPGRSARNHLLFLAQTQGLPSRRVDEVLELVGLQEVARKRARGYSLGMSQRVGIAAAMLGDPSVLLLDEPVNGLDPEGDPVDQEPDEAPGLRAAHDLRLQPPDERDGGDRGPPDRDRQGEADRRKQRHRSSSSGARRSPCWCARRTPKPLAGLIAAEGGKAIPQDTGRGPEQAGAERDRPGRAPDRGDRRREPDRPARTGPAAGSLEEAFMEMTADSVEYGGDTPAVPQEPAASTTSPGSSQ